MSTELALPVQFHKTAVAFPSQVKIAIAKMPSAQEAADGLAQADAISEYARRIKATTEDVNHVQYGKLLLAAKVGELCPAEVGGRGKNSSGSQTGFAKQTMADYRKLAKHQERGKIDDYFEAVAEVGHDTEMSIAGFLRFVADGNLKTNENKSLIEWYTPKKYIEAAREVMGGIDLDPASSDVANEVVQAARYLTKEDDGLSQAWSGRVWLNPPYTASLISNFIRKLLDHHQAGEVPQAVLLTSNGTDTQWWHDAIGVCALACFTQGRVHFYSPVREQASPASGNTFFYFGNRVAAFRETFREFGAILRLDTEGE